MRKPTIDELLDHEESIYTLTMLAAKRARQLKILDRESKLPLQVALNEVAHGRVHAEFEETEVDDERLVEGMRRPAEEIPEEEMPPSAFDDEEEAQQTTLFPNT
jgi:DNA-directed RNA polymerase omega subunit